MPLSQRRKLTDVQGVFKGMDPSGAFYEGWLIEFSHSISISGQKNQLILSSAHHLFSFHPQVPGLSVLFTTAFTLFL